MCRPFAKYFYKFTKHSLKTNTITYTDDIDNIGKPSFGHEEGIVLPSSKEEFAAKLKTFEGKYVTHCKIDWSKYKTEQGKWRYLGRVFEFDIDITRKFTYKFYSGSTTTKSKYKFIFISKVWELYKDDVLIYSDHNYKSFEDPTNHAKQFKDAQLIKININKDWNQATFEFGNGYCLKCAKREDKPNFAHFFSLIQETEPYRKHMFFDKPENIFISNESTQSIVKPRRKRAKVSEGMPNVFSRKTKD